MSLEKQLHDLQKQKREELRTLHVTYIRTKRNVKHALSPDRIIRRHLTASLSIAAVAGLLLAPRSGGSESRSEKPPRRSGSRFPSWLKTLLHKFLPQAAAYIPGLEESPDPAPSAAAPAAEKAPPSKSTHRTFLAEIALLLLSKIDLQKMIAQLVHSLTSHIKSSPPTHEDEAAPAGHPEAPDVTLADAATLRDPATVP